jgi:hypothetical protein
MYFPPFENRENLIRKKDHISSCSFDKIDRVKSKTFILMQHMGSIILSIYYYPDSSNLQYTFANDLVFINNFVCSSPCIIDRINRSNDNLFSERGRKRGKECRQSLRSPLYVIYSISLVGRGYQI